MGGVSPIAIGSSIPRPFMSPHLVSNAQSVPHADKLQREVVFQKSSPGKTDTIAMFFCSVTMVQFVESFQPGNNPVYMLLS